jgi:hypothetical protein
MPYFKTNDLNLLLIHIPKTGGTSIENYFFSKYNIKRDISALWLFLPSEIEIGSGFNKNISLQHQTYETIYKFRNELNVDFEDLKVIAVVRNPYERAISDLFFNKLITVDTTPEEVYDIIKNKFIPMNPDNHALPQYMYLMFENKLLTGIDILNTETLTEDMKKIGYTDFDLHDNTNLHKVDYYKYLNKESIKLINLYYKLDFVYFNYKMIKTDKENKIKLNKFAYTVIRTFAIPLYYVMIA